jgi:hypothetical protein
VTPPPNPRTPGLIARAWLLTWEYLASRYLGGVNVLVRLPAGLRAVPPEARSSTIALLTVLGILIVATPLLYVHGHRLSGVVFHDVIGERRELPLPSLYLALLGVVSSTAAILAAASHARPAIFWLSAPICVYTISTIALVGGRAYLVVAASWLVPVLAATTPVAARHSTRLVTLLVFSALAAWHTYTFTPLSDRFPDASPASLLAWLAPLAVLTTLGLYRFRWRLTTSSAFVLAGGANLLALSPVLGSDQLVLARGTDGVMTGVFTLFAVFYFALGGRLAQGSLEAANSTLKALEWLAGGPRRLFLLLPLAWLVVALVIRRQLQSPPTGFEPLIWLHVIVLLLGSVVALALWARGSLTETWIRGILGIWFFSYLVPEAYYAAGAALNQTAAVGIMALTFFILGLGTDAVKTLPKLVRRESRWGSASAILLLYVSALTFLATITHFQFVSKNTGWMAETLEIQFLGMFALLPPMLLWLVLREQRWLAPPAPGRIATAFLAGAIGSVPVTLLRIASPVDGQWTLAGHMGAVALAEAVKLALIGAIVLASPAAGRWLDATAIGMAVALGFGVAYLGSVTLFFFQQFGLIVINLTVASAAARELVASVITNNALLLHRPWADYFQSYLASLPAAALMAGAFFWGRQRGRPWIGLAGALGMAVASIGYARILYTRRLLLDSLNVSVADELLADRVALAAVLFPLALLAFFLYWTVWRIDVGRGSTAPTATEGEATPRSRIAALVTASASLAVAAIWLTLSPAFGRAPLPMHEYEAPEGDFSILYPNGWRVRQLPPKLTVFYRGTKQPNLAGGIHLLVHSRAPLPCGTDAAELVQELRETETGRFPDFHLEARPGPETADGKHVKQVIELETSKTLQSGIPMTSRGWIVYTRGPECPTWELVTYQAPRFVMDALEPLFRRMVDSYESASPE